MINCKRLIILKKYRIIKKLQIIVRITIKIRINVKDIPWFNSGKLTGIKISYIKEIKDQLVTV